MFDRNEDSFYPLNLVQWSFFMFDIAFFSLALGMERLPTPSLHVQMDSSESLCILN